MRVAWENDLGGRTFEIGDGGARRFVKWAPAGSGLDLGAEAARLRWAVAYTAVPRVLGEGRDGEGSWLVTAGLAGENAVSERHKRAPARAAAAIGRGLRAFHDALPVARCPFSWSLEERLGDVRRRAGELDPARWHAAHQPLGVAGALAALARAPSVDRLVVCHGDACAPNTLLAEDGSVTGHVDLGCLGVADRWADIAVATWSLEWNYGPGFDQTLLEAYGVAPDAARVAYYRLLWDLGP
jgi:aminoglycoside phosphotransferase